MKYTVLRANFVAPKRSWQHVFITCFLRKSSDCLQLTHPAAVGEQNPKQIAPHVHEDEEEEKSESRRNQEHAQVKWNAWKERSTRFSNVLRLPRLCMMLLQHRLFPSIKIITPTCSISLPSVRQTKSLLKLMRRWMRSCHFRDNHNFKKIKWHPIVQYFVKT